MRMKKTKREGYISEEGKKEGVKELGEKEGMRMRERERERCGTK